MTEFRTHKKIICVALAAAFVGGAGVAQAAFRILQARHSLLPRWRLKRQLPVSDCRLPPPSLLWSER